MVTTIAAFLRQNPPASILLTPRQTDHLLRALAQQIAYQHADPYPLLPTSFQDLGTFNKGRPVSLEHFDHSLSQVKLARCEDREEALVAMDDGWTSNTYVCAWGFLARMRVF